jgi:DNA-binding NtrC family response regulator
VDGCQLALTATRARPEMRVLLMSGYAPSMIEGSQHIDVERQFLPKPFTVQGLLAKVRDALAS